MKKLIQVCTVILFFNFISNAQVSWHAVPGAPLTVRMDDVTFINDSTGWTVAHDTVFKTSDKGETWNALSPFTGYMRSIEFINETTGFIGTLSSQDSVFHPAGLFKTTDGGTTFIRIDSLLPVPPAFGICGIAHLGNLIVATGSAGGEQKVYKSTDAGQSWILINLDLLSTFLVDVYIVDNLTYLVSGQSDDATGNKATILRTSDGGLTWNRAAISSSVPYTFCWKMFIRPSGVGLASVEDFGAASVFRTVDYGATWNEIIIPNPQTIDLGGVGLLNDTLGWVGNQHQDGLYETTDGGLTWSYINYGNSWERMVALDSVTMLAVGNTVYKYGSGAVGINEPPVKSKNAHEFSVHPNPASDKLTAELKLHAGTIVLLCLIDEKGRLIKKIEHSVLAKGDYHWTVNLHSLKNGSYMIYLFTNQQNFARKFQVVH